MSRKDRIAPFEVMRSGRDRQPNAASPTTDDPSLEEQEHEPVSPPVFEPTGSGPLVLRIPRGYAVVAAVLLLGLFTMVYWVGYSRGDKDRLSKIRQEQVSREEMYNRTADIAAGGSGAVLNKPPVSQSSVKTNVVAGGESSQVTGSNHGKYVAGFNYFVLVHYPPKEANELVEFLGQHGVDAAAILVNNNRFKVVALEGFLASELDSAKVREYKQLLRRLGRLWQDSKRGAGDLSDMYPERYDGPEGKTR
jgi:hypothetical protein